MAATNGSTAAIELRQEPETAITPFAPTSMEQGIRLAEMLARSALVPSAVRGKPADIFVILATGRELGIGPMQALSDINVIQGKPVMSADLMVSQCKKHPEVCRYIRLVETNEQRAVYETQRVGSPEPERFAFTMDDAKRLGLDGKDNYKKQPKTMLRRRCAAALAREVYPDLVRGYDPDEAEDFARPQRVTAPPPSPVSVPVEVEVVGSSPVPDDLPSPALDADEPEGPADTLVRKVKSAETLDALSALLPAIQTAKQAGVDVAEVREAYAAKKKELAS